jgi:hypothetical protein
LIWLIFGIIFVNPSSKLRTMKNLSFLFWLIPLMGHSQATIEQARSAVQSYYMSSYSYHEQFIGHDGYGAPVILTSDGGAAVFGDGEVEGLASGLLVIVDSTGQETWKAVIRKQFDEMESQSVVEDDNGNLYIFMLSYDNSRYRGGSERVMCYDSDGELLWDKTLGNYTLTNNPTISYIRNKDGKIYLRGHIVLKEAVDGKDPIYHFWEGWLDSEGNLTQKSGEVINWSDKTWQDLYKPE